MNMMTITWPLNYMKRILFIICLLVLCGCSSNKEIKSTPKNIISPLTDKFSYEEGKCLRSDLMLSYKKLNRGDVVEIIEEEGNYYYIDNNGIVLAISKDHIRTENEEQFIEYIGYTRSGCGLYSDIDLSDRINVFSLNDTVTVKDEFLGVLYVEYNGKIGYMLPSQVSDSKLSEYVAPKKDDISIESYDNSSSGSNSGGNDSGSAQDSTPSQTSGDGDDISLAYYNPHSTIKLLADTNNLKGFILVDNTEAYIAILNRNDDVYIVGENDNNYYIVFEGRKCEINKKYIRKNNEPEYEKWEAYAYGGTVIYEDYLCSKTLKTLQTNDIVSVIDNVDGICVVEYDNNKIGYVDYDDLSKEWIVIKKPIVVEEEVVPSSSGSNSSTPAPAPAPEWTAPAL